MIVDKLALTKVRVDRRLQTDLSLSRFFYCRTIVRRFIMMNYDWL